MKDRSRLLNLMFHRLDLHFNNHRSLWENHDLVNTQIGHFLDKNNELSKLLTQSEALKGKYSPIRDHERKLLNNSISKLANTMLALNAQLAFDEMGEFKKMLLISKYALSKLPLSESFNRATSIILAADLNQAELNTLPQTKKIYEMSKEHYNSFAMRLFLPTLRIGERKMILQGIDQIEKQLLELLKVQIDARMVLLADDLPEFYAAYVNIRKMRIYKAYKKQNVANENQVVSLTQRSEPEQAKVQMNGLVEIQNNPHDDLGIAV